MAKPNPADLKFNIVALDVDSFHQFNYKGQIHNLHQNKEKQYNLDFETDGSLGLYEELDIIQMKLKITVSAKAKKGDNVPVCNLETTTDFKVENLKSLRTGDTYTVPFRLSFTIQTVAYSTTRGILYERMAASRIGGVLMPLVDISQSPKRDMVFNVAKK